MKKELLNQNKEKKLMMMCLKPRSKSLDEDSVWSWWFNRKDTFCPLTIKRRFVRKMSFSSGIPIVDDRGRTSINGRDTWRIERSSSWGNRVVPMVLLQVRCVDPMMVNWIKVMEWRNSGSDEAVYSKKTDEHEDDLRSRMVKTLKLQELKALLGSRLRWRWRKNEFLV